MPDLKLTIALERYDRHVPFFMGLVKPPEGLSLTPLEVGMTPPRRDGVDRHRRFLQDREFDIAETSLSSHIIATSRGQPFVGIPVFPRRLFSQNHFFVNANSGIEKPTDLIGKRVILRTFQTTMSVLALGDLKFEYGVPWEKIHWIVASDEVLPIESRDGRSIERIDMSANIGRMLIEGEVDGMIHPHPHPRCWKQETSSARCSPTAGPRRSGITERRATTQSCTWSPFRRSSSRSTHGSPAQ